MRDLVVVEIEMHCWKDCNAKLKACLAWVIDCM